MEKKLKVLIADNSSQFAKACQNELETQGYDVSVIENDGAKVLEIVKKHNIDVILMDVFMVNEDAVDVLEYYQTHSVEKPIISVLSSVSSEELEKQVMSAGADYFFIKPITANQIGWYSYQSWHLSNDNRYNKGEISHRFYISADSSIIPKFIVVLKEKLEQMAIPYYFKVSSASIVGTTQKDGIVIYSSTNNLNQVILALQEIQNEYPDIVHKCNEPHLFCGNINGWIGYANEIKNQKNSYTNLMSKIMYDSFEASVLDWIRENSEVTINDGSKNVKVSQYFNRNIINEESQKDYITYIKRLGHLIHVIPKFDKNFKPKLYRIIKNNLIKNNIDPNNICFNFDVLEELVEYNNHLTKSQDITNHNTDFKI